MASSILEQVQAISSVKRDIADVLEAYGVTVGSRFSDYASAIQKVDLTDDTGFIVNHGLSSATTWPECISCFVMPSQVMTVNTSVSVFVYSYYLDGRYIPKGLPISALHLNRVTGLYGSNCFARTQSLSEVDGPEVREVSAVDAFRECSSLRRVCFPKCSFVGDRAFMGCSELTDVSMPNASRLGQFCFGECFKMSIASFPGCTEVGESAFYRCEVLSSVSLPQCQTVGESAFAECYALPSLTLSQCRTVGSGAFAYCFALSSISLPNVESLGDSVFCMDGVDYSSESSFASRLVLDLTGVPKLPTVGKDLYLAYTDKNNDRFRILVPASLYSAFLSADGWSIYSSNIVSSAT